MTPPGRSAITRGDILTIAAGLTVLAAIMVLSQAAFDLAWILVYTVAAACALEMARNLRWFVRDDYPVVLTLSLAVVGALQLLHVAVELDLVSLGSRSHEAAGHIELATGFVLAGSMLMAPFTLGRRIRPSLWGAVISITAGLLVAAIVWWHGFPQVLEGAGVSTFARAGDLVIAGLLLAAGTLTWRRRRLLERQFLVAMQVALGVAALGWVLQALLQSEDITHLMSVLFIVLICIAITRNGLARPTALLFTQMTEDKLQALDELRASEQLIERMAFHDALTGLANRTLLRDRLRQTLASSDRSGRGVAVLYVDVDRFADLNHLMGHTGADNVLQAVAARLRPVVREADTIARWGADEFVVVLQDVPGSDGARRVATKIRAALADPWHVEGHSFDVTASVGIALFPGDGGDADALLEHVVIAAQEAKDRGGDTYQFYDHVMGSEVAQRIEIDHELRLALQREELDLLYQPQIDLITEAMTGVEALVRWRHPAQGLLPPAAFLPVAESTGLIEDLTSWVIGEACRQAAEWQAGGYQPLRIAVNVSARDFKSGAVPETVDAALAASGLSPEWLEVELTETAVVADTESTAAQLEALRGRGVGIALDDFGTGYSSLTHLQTLPISRVKIDRSFVSRVCKDERAAAIVGSMITLINSLGLETIAEGVDSADELAYLRASGCSIGQGYLFSRPLPAEELAMLQATAHSAVGRGVRAR